MAGFSIDTVADSPKAYQVLCWRDGPTWAVRLPELDLESSAARLAEVEAVARALVGARDTERAAASFDIEFLPDTLPTALSAADTLRAEADHRGPVSAPSESPSPVWGSVTGRAGGQPQSGYRHEALFYRDDDEFLAGTVPFIEEALALRQPVMVALPEPRLTLVREALGSGASNVRMVDMGRLGANPARIIPAWREFIDEACRDGQPVRGIGEPLWPGRHEAEVAECQLHEALLNIAVEPWRRLWLRCPYDVQRLGTPESEGALHSHPTVVEGSSHRDSPDYAGAPQGISMFGAQLPDPPASTDLLEFGPANLPAVRSQVAAQTAAAGLDAERAADLTLAVWELATNSVEHGGGQGTLRIWREPNALVCEVADRGHIGDVLVGRRLPDPTSLGQRGMWLVNQLSDLVQIRSDAQGTTTRIFTWL